MANLAVSGWQDSVGEPGLGPPKTDGGVAVTPAVVRSALGKPRAEAVEPSHGVPHARKLLRCQQTHPNEIYP